MNDKTLTSIDDKLTLGSSRFVQSLVMGGQAAGIRKLLLTPDQIRLVVIIGQYEFVTSYFIKGLLDVSIQNASSKLKRLYEAGYLVRSTREADTGGIEYTYERVVQ